MITRRRLSPSFCFDLSLVGLPRFFLREARRVLEPPLSLGDFCEALSFGESCLDVSPDQPLYCLDNLWSFEDSLSKGSFITSSPSFAPLRGNRFLSKLFSSYYSCTCISFYLFKRICRCCSKLTLSSLVMSRLSEESSFSVRFLGSLSSKSLFN